MNTVPLTLYRDFALQIGKINRRTRRFTVRINGTIPGNQPAADEQELVAYEPERFTAEVDGTRDNLLALLQRRSLTDAQLMGLGRALADHLMPRSIRRHFWDSIEVVRAAKRRLRLRLQIEAPELASLPWEYLYLAPLADARAGEGSFLALLPEVSIVRHAALDQLELSALRPDGYRLVAAGGPTKAADAGKLQPNGGAIGAAIAEAGAIGPIVPTWVADATRDTLFDALRTGADIFHFVGGGVARGRDGRIVLAASGKPGARELYQGRQLADALQLASTRLAVLELGGDDAGAAWSGITSVLLETGVGAVVASRADLPERCADLLARELYQGALGGATLDEALTRTRLAIAQQDGPERLAWGAVTLAMRLADGVVIPSLETLKAHAESKNIIINVSQVFKGDIGPGAIVRGVQADTIGSTILATGTPQAQTDARLAPVVRPLTIAVPLVGRDTALQTLEQRLRAGRRLYLHGAYGVGKTSLAAALFTRVESSFADGRVWYRVANKSPAAVLELVAEEFADPPVAQAATLEQKQAVLRRLLARRPDMLIALDEVGDRAVAEALLESAGGCAVILNGDRPLGLGGALHEESLQPLSDDDAVALFVALARPGQPEDALAAEERALIRQMCERLGNLPLAIKLAAAKHAEEGESLESLWRRVRDELSSLAAADTRVESIFSLHYEALKNVPDALQLLVRIAGFPTLEAPLAALQQGGLDGRLFSAKDALLSRGLVQSAGADRLALHPLLGTAVQSVEADAVSRACQQANDWLRAFASTNRAAYDALAREHENLLGLLDWYAAREQWDDMVGLLRDLFEYLRVRSQWDVVLQRLELALRAAGTLAGAWNRGWAYLHRGIMHMLRSEYPAAASDFDHADTLFAEVGDQAYRGKVLFRRATLSIVGGDLITARTQLEQALEWMADKAPAHDRAAAHERLASLLVTQGELDAARQHYDRALALGDPEEQARVQIALGVLARQQGDYDAAERHYADAMKLAGQIGHVLYRATTEQELGYLHYYQGRLDLARAHFDTALGLYRQLDYQPGLAQALHALGNVALARYTEAERGLGDSAGAPEALAEAERAYQEALAINQGRGIVVNVAYNQYQLAVVLRKRGEFLLAEQRTREALAGAERGTDVALQAAALLQLASLALNRGDHAAAADTFARSAELAVRAGDRLTEATSQYYQGVLQAQEGNLEAARATLAGAHAAFAALNSVDAGVIERLLDDLRQNPEMLAPTPSRPPVLGGPVEESSEVDPGAWARIVEGGRALGGLLVGIRAGSSRSGIATSAQDIDVVTEGKNVGVRIDDLGE